jgi:hypothetical protein
MKAATKLWILCLFALLSWAATPQFRFERVPVAGGAELITVFGTVPESSAGLQTDPGREIPLLTVLRDTLGHDDPDHNLLRYVWVHTSSNPTLIERAAAALPFFYWRPQNSHSADGTPSPVLNLASPARPAIGSLAGSITQLVALDPNGALVRSSTRSYRNNLEDYRRLHLLEGLALMTQLDGSAEAREYLSEDEFEEIETRLMLASRSLGGFVSNSSLDAAYMKQRARLEETRGHNWELLRQRAEANGLYFQPFGIDGSSTHALLWIAVEDLNSGRKFDPQFLGIADPYHDKRLEDWRGYREVRLGKEMIPLALYALDYPKVPLLVVDFRDTHRPKQREMIRHAFTDTVSGVLGISKFGNPSFLFGSMAFNFITVRHGAANDRNARLNAYAEVREWLALDQSLNPAFRSALEKRLEMMGVNPMEQSIAGETKIAQRQYAALLRYAADPNGLPARLTRDRAAELYDYHHGLSARFGYTLAHAATFGLYKHPAEPEVLLEAQLDEARRVERETKFLETVAKSSSRPEIVWNMDDVRRALDDVAAAHLPARTERLVREIMGKTHDEETRALCARTLQAQSPEVAVAGQQ